MLLQRPDNEYSTVEIDALSGVDAMTLMLESHINALGALRGVKEELCQAAGLMAVAFEVGRTVHFVAAGSSGLMAFADACELTGTFGISPQQTKINMAGGVPVEGGMLGASEDSVGQAIEAASTVQPGDVAIVLSASGTTPYVLGFARHASQRGAKVIGISNEPGSALLEASDIKIAIHTGKEVIEGSTRLGAATAQKAALNMISTQAGALMGHVHDGLMVNLNADNSKLRCRATAIVSQIAQVSQEDALNALQQMDFNTKRATLLAYGLAEEEVIALLDRYRGRLAPCLEVVRRQAEEKA